MMCEDKAREGNLLEMLGRCENSLQLSGLSALVKINSLTLQPVGLRCGTAPVITTSAVGGCLAALYS